LQQHLEIFPVGTDRVLVRYQCQPDTYLLTYQCQPWQNKKH